MMGLDRFVDVDGGRKMFLISTPLEPSRQRSDLSRSHTGTQLLECTQLLLGVRRREMEAPEH